MPRFVNWAHTARSQPQRWERPATVEEVVELVTSVAARGGRIKVVGAGHSFNAIAAPDGVALTLDALAGVISAEGDQAWVWGGTRLRDLNAALADRGLALPILGSVAEQSIAGAIATGTHGSSLVHGNLASFVTGLRLVDGRGEVRELNEAQLAGARVHLGALGVVTAVRVQVVPAFRLEQTIERVPVGDVSGQLEAIARSAEFVKIWWVPHTRDALVIRYQRTDRAPQRRVRVERSIDQRLIHPIVLPLIYFLQRVLPATVPLLNAIMGATLVKGPRIGVSTQMFSTPLPVRHDETEAVVPLARGGEAWDALVRVTAEVRVNFIAELRFVRGDDGWLSPASGGDVVQLGAYTAHAPDHDAYFARFWDAMRALGARPHWGKMMDHTAAQLAPLYDDWARFAALRNELDPDRVFVNAFLERTLGP